MADLGQHTIALITGASKGIGKETARRLGALGMTVLVGARDAGRGQAAASELTGLGADARHLQLDVTDQQSLDAAREVIDTTYGRLDVLVNNAGISLEQADDIRGVPSAVPVAILRATYQTNVFGVVAVPNTLLPLLRRSRAGRIVNVSSTMR